VQSTLKRECKVHEGCMVESDCLFCCLALIGPRLWQGSLQGYCDGVCLGLSATWLRVNPVQQPRCAWTQDDRMMCACTKSVEFLLTRGAHAVNLVGSYRCSAGRAQVILHHIDEAARPVLEHGPRSLAHLRVNGAL
jgi:hypothetical protein